MYRMTFVVGIERFNGAVWDEIRAALKADSIDCHIDRFHEGHIDQRDASLQRALHDSDVVFLSLINMRPQAEWLQSALEQSRAKAVFAYESMPEVMALTRVGEHRFKARKSEPPKVIQALMRLVTRGRDEDTLYTYAKLVKIAAKMLPLVPKKMAGFRTWLSVNLYWNQPDVGNLTQMLRLIMRDVLQAEITVEPLRVIPLMGCFDARTGILYDNPKAWHAARKKAAAKSNEKHSKNRPQVAVLAMRKHVVQRLPYLREFIEGLESRGLAVLPVFVSGIEAHVAIREWLVHEPIDAFVSTMGFSVVGGPAASTKPGHYHETAADLLAALDVPYFVMQPLLMQDENEWRDRGVHAMQSVVMYDLPEMDGVAHSLALGAVRDGALHVLPDRVQRAADQVESWVKLRHKKVEQKRIALVVYDYPPGMGKAGTAALLDVPKSLVAILGRLAAEGYDIGDAPLDAVSLSRQLDVLSRGEAGIKLTLKDFRRMVQGKTLDRIDDFWGAAPGDIAAAGRDALRLDVLEFGNVVIGLQPPMGVPGDPMRLLFERSFTPHHQYVGFYSWLKHGFAADALVHVGMHGTAEWMPGLQAALTADCWPDALLGGFAHLYLYPLNNPAEAAIARRRGYATVISHAVPPYARAGTYKQLAQLAARLDDSTDELQGALPDKPRAEGESLEDYRARAQAWLKEIEQRLIVEGLHVFGVPPAPEKGRALVEAALDVPRTGQPGLRALVAASAASGTSVRVGEACSALIDRCIEADESPERVYREFFESQMPSAVTGLVAEGRAIRAGLARCDEELAALMRALSGHFIRPAFGADPVRAGSAALPSGRNIHGIDPWRLPSELALQRGRQAAQVLLAAHHAEHGAWPRTVAQSIWAMDTIKSEGEGLAVVLALVGAEPERDGQGKIFRFRLLPLAELGRPRIDVLLDVSSIFRDTFKLSLDLLDDLFRQAARVDEPVELNHVRANTLAMLAEGLTEEQATARVFTQAPGLYGTGVDQLIEESQWESETDLAAMFQQRCAHTAGGARNGAAAPETLRGLLGRVDHVFQAIDSVEYGLTDMSHYYGHSGALQVAAQQATGRSVGLSYAETFTGEVRVTRSQDLVQLETRAKLLNPRWYEAMLAHGHSGAAEIGNRFTHLLGWGAVGAAQDWMFKDAADTFILDEAMRKRLEAVNPQAVRNAMGRLMEANGRGLWQADEQTLEALQGLYADLEDRLEGVAAAEPTTQLTAEVAA
jgi:magnesium chelatase subunit H